MTIYEILSFNKELLQRLFNAGIKTSDCLYVDLFNDYTRMRAAGEKNDLYRRRPIRQIRFK